MKNFFKIATVLSLVLYAFVNETFAQRSTGINNTTPSDNAALDVKETSSYPQGILVPRLPGSDSTIINSRITASDNGLMFFDTISKVFQYWNGTRWVSLGGSSASTSNGWSLTGNTGTSTSANFIGTTNNASLRFRTKNLTRMHIDSATGYVGIGLTDPNSLLTVNGGIASNNYVTFWGHQRIRFSSTGVNPFLSIENIASGVGIKSIIDFNNLNSGATIKSSARIGSQFTNNAVGGEMGAFTIEVANANVFSEKLRILASGNVGIGTTSPTTKLQVIGQANADTLSANLKIRLGTTATSGQVLTTDANGYGTWQAASGGWALTGNSGTTASTYFIGTIDDRSFCVRTKNIKRMLIDSLGNVGIGMNPSGSYILEIAGNLKTAGITETSDLRWKKDVKTLSNTLAKVGQLRGVSYNWRKDEFPEKNFDNKEQIGLIAQEVEKIYPQLVDTDALGFKSIQYSKVVALLIEALKEQQTEIGSLKAEVSKMSQLEQKVNSLTALVEILAKQNPVVETRK